MAKRVDRGKKGKVRMRPGRRLDIERLGQRRLKEVQDKALKAVINWACKMPFYRRRLHAGAKRAVKDLSHVPLLSKEDLLRSMGGRRLPRPCWTKVHELSFIGMTGGPGIESTDDAVLPVPLRPVDMCRRGSTAARALRATGPIGGRTIMLEEISHNVVHQALLRGLIDTGGSPVQLGRGFTLRHVRHTIPRLAPRNMVTYPTYAMFLSDLLEKEGRALRLGKVVLWGEIGGSDTVMRKRIRKAFGAQTFDLYATQETGVLAGECTAHDGMHGFEDMFLYEVIDPDTGDVLDDGKRGELVVTELEKSAMPLIRYRTGDITSIKRGRCRCGRSHLRLEAIRGRVGQGIGSKDGSMIYAADIAEKVWPSPHLTGAFKMDPREGVVVETKEHKEMSRYYLDKMGPLPVKVTFERLLPHFRHRTEYFDDERYHALLKEQTRLEV